MLAPRLRRQYDCFFNAWVFLTRFPAPRGVRFHNRLLEKSAVYFPWVGAILGLLLGGLLVLLQWVFPSALALLLMMAAGIYATGAFHEDGWADTCDALGGGYTPEEIKRIMRDSRLGTYGVVGITMMLGLKFCALWYLLQILPLGPWWLLFILGQAGSRWSILLVMMQLPYARDDEASKSKPLAKAMRSDILIRGALPPALLLLCMIAFTDINFAQLLLISSFALAAALYLAHLLRKAIGGFTGDGLGATQQLSELCVYLGGLAAFSVS